SCKPIVNVVCDGAGQDGGISGGTLDRACLQAGCREKPFDSVLIERSLTFHSDHMVYAFGILGRSRMPWKECKPMNERLYCPSSGGRVDERVVPGIRDLARYRLQDLQSL